MMSENLLSVFKKELGYVNATNQYVELSIRITEKEHINKKTETWDILGKTTELGFLYRGKYKDCINDWFDCQRGRRDIQVSVGWSILLSPATTLFPL